MSRTQDDSREEPASERRVDRWLWFARVLKSRTLAAKLVAAGKVRMNKVRIDRPSQVVRVGDVLTIAVHDKVRVLKVVAPGTRRGPPAEARTLYEDLTPIEAPREAGPAVAPRDPGAGRPTKLERRRLDELKGE